MTSKITIACSHCGVSLPIPSEYIGRKVRCPKCSQSFVVPTNGAEQTQEIQVSRDTEVHTPKSPRASTQSNPHANAEGTSGTAKILGKIGRFELREILGQGGFGRVYRAYDPQLDREVALKVPTFGPQDKHKINRFLTEAKAAAGLRHPHIVPTFESGHVDGRYYIATQYVKGKTLAQTIKTDLPTVERSVGMVVSFARALAYAHHEGIVHRDIKPENIMLDGRGEPQLMDFGLAKRLNEDSGMTTEGTLMGTPAYMSPEQARADTANVGPRSDQYAVGAILYELLCGQRAFDGPPHSVLAQLLSQEPPTIRSIKASIPKDLEAIAQKAMCKEAQGRYATCGALADDLERWLRGETTMARPATLAERWIRWSRRNKTLATLSAATFAVILIAIAGVSTAWVKTEAARSDAVEQKQRADEKANEATQQTRLVQTEKQRAEQQSQEATRQTLIAQTEKVRADQKANEAQSNLQSAERERQRATEKAAHLAFERGVELCRDGDLIHGVFAFIDALELNTGGDSVLDRTIRRALAFRQDEMDVLCGSLRVSSSDVKPTLSGDGRYLAWSDPGRAKQFSVYDVESKQTLIEQLPNGAVTCMAFHLQESILFVGDNLPRITAYRIDAAGIHQIAEFPQKFVPRELECSRDGKSFFCLDSKPSLKKFNVLTRLDAIELTLNLEHNDVADSGLLRTSADGEVYGMIHKNTELKIWDHGKFRSISDVRPYDLDLSPDGTRFCSGTQFRASVGRIENAKRTSLIEHVGFVNNCRFLDNQRLITPTLSELNSVAIYDIAIKEPLHKVFEISGNIDDTVMQAATPNSPFHAAISGQSDFTVIPHPKHRTLRTRGQVQHVSIDREGRTVAVVSRVDASNYQGVIRENDTQLQGHIQIWKLRPPRITTTVPEHLGDSWRLRWISNDELLTGSDNRLARRVKRIGNEWVVSKTYTMPARIRGVGTHPPSGQWSYSAGFDIYLSSSGGEPQPILLGGFEPIKNTVTMLEYTYDGKYLVAGCAGPGRIVTIDTTTRKVVHSRMLNDLIRNVNTLKIIRIGVAEYLFVGAEYGPILCLKRDGFDWNLHDIEGSKSLDGIAGKVTDAHVIKSLEISADGRSLYFGDWFKSVNQFDLVKQQPTILPFRHPGAVWRVVMHPDQSLLLSAGESRTIEFCDPRTMLPVADAYTYPLGALDLDVSPDGTLVAICGIKNSLIIEKLPKPIQGNPEQLRQVFEQRLGVTRNAVGLIEVVVPPLKNETLR